MAKKRKDTPRASTLHNFFASQGTASAAKRPKLSSITPRRTVAVKKTSPAPEDIIVIDDSDDDHAVETPSRPARAAPKHSVSNARTSRAASGSGRGLPLRYTQESDSDVEVLESPIHKVAKDTMSFGTPTLLIDRESITSGPAHEDMDFGRAVLLLQSGDGADTNSSVSTGAVGLKASCPSSAVSNTPRETIEDPVEEWGTGDDEMDATNGESAFVTEPVAGPSNIIAARVENTERCPICDKELVGMNALVNLTYASRRICFS
ncbi:hypothetical protein BDW22DRAFT_577032 [Trametopsis cervina]|nr:hypothetical protein BDW22DRAFT_577032 [Trametopsis cervina]